MTVFVKKKESKPLKDLTIATMQGRKAKKGVVGLEIEVEASVANSLPKGTAVIADYWRAERDGSLRGADNAEYVLTKPIEFEQVPDALDKLWAEFTKAKVKLNDSLRTSVHVHLNVTSFYQNRLAALLGLWFIFEEVLSYWCGDHRAGNLFCVRAKDGESIIRQIKGWLEAKGRFQLNNEALHYSALNMAALNKFGSLEVRTMGGILEPEPGKQWVRILRKLYDESVKYKDPRTLIEKFSLEGPLDFFLSVFGEEAEGILKNVGDLDLRDSLFEGMRFAQEVVYARDWSDFHPTKEAVDPFMRRKVSEEVGEAQELEPYLADRRLVEPAPPRQARRVAVPDWMQEEMQRAVRNPFYE